MGTLGSETGKVSLWGGANQDGGRGVGVGAARMGDTLGRGAAARVLGVTLGRSVGRGDKGSDTGGLSTGVGGGGTARQRMSACQQLVGRH